MNKWFLAMLVALITATSSAQITLEHTYPNAGYYNSEWGDQLFLWEFEVSGAKYVKIDRSVREITLYNIDHSYFTSFSFAGAPATSGIAVIMYLSQSLFDQDVGFEYLFVTSGGTLESTYTRIYDQDETVLLNLDGCAPFVFPTTHQQQYPISSGPEGTKFIISCGDQSVRVYSLPGTWDHAMGLQDSDLTGSASTGALLFPDPTADLLNIRLQASEAGMVQAVQMIDEVGRITQLRTVTTSADLLSVDVGALSSGLYTVQLLTQRGWMSAGRFIKERSAR